MMLPQVEAYLTTQSARLTRRDGAVAQEVAQGVAEEIAEETGQEIGRVKTRGAADDESFNRLALDVFAYQYEHVPLYRRLCDLRGVRPRDVAHWSEVPAAPADLFKEDAFAPQRASSARHGQAGGNDEDGPAVTFLSSGTTQTGRRSRHVLTRRELELYRLSSLAQFSAMVLPDRPGPMSVLLVAPGRTTHPASSLGHMFQFVGEAFAAPTSAVAGDAASAEGFAGLDVSQPFDRDGKLDIDATVGRLAAAASGTRPLLVLALRSTLTAVFEALRKRQLELRLPADSRIVHTGGSKGGRTMSRNGILKAAWRFLHIPAYLCVEEYGMTELLSQFYDDALHSRWSGVLSARSMIGPPWVRSIVVDPATLAPVPRGERGILRHFDLANCGAISAVQTLDVGFERGLGFEVSGRATGAETRGCSQLLSSLV